MFFYQAIKYLEIIDVPRKIAPNFSFFLFHLQVDTGRAGGETILPERQKRGGCTASFLGGGEELYEIMDGGQTTLIRLNFENQTLDMLNICEPL